jgi:methionine synthase I (cobalamin-dependent)
MRDAPDQVRAVHEDYLRVGAQIVTTNSFWTNPGRLSLAGLADEWEPYTRLAGELAKHM